MAGVLGFLRVGSCAGGTIWSPCCTTVLGRFATLNGAQGEQRRTLVTKELLKLPADYPEPWDYREKGYDWTQWPFDRTKKRIHQNSKLIIVEGNVGAGVSEKAAEIADILGFHHMPAFKMDNILVDRYGNDLRNFYHLFPKRFRMPDIKMFHQNPNDDMSAVMQDRIYFCRHEQYMNALAHILNTGEGVVLERSVYSDFVFLNAMRSKNYIGHEYFRHYFYVRRCSLPPLKLYPHVMVYLDAPIDKCLENIKKRGDSDEIAVLDEKYLDVIHRSYKDFIKDLKRHSFILAYDLNKEVETDTIIEDLLKLDLDFFEWHTTDVLETWFTLTDDIHWTRFRNYITEKTNARIQSFDSIKKHEVGELWIDPADATHFMAVMHKEVLKDYKSYGTTHKDSKQGLGAWRHFQLLPERWSEYFFREAYFNGMHSFNTLLDPYFSGYDPDYLEHQH